MTCWLPVALAVVAVTVASLTITKAPTQYVALGRFLLIADYWSSDRRRDERPGVEEFLGAQLNAQIDARIEILESSVLKRRALERVRGLHPELKEIGVEIHATNTKGSSILKMTAVGAEQKYTRVYLDALLDEFMAFQQEMMEKSVGTAMNKVIEEVLTREQQVKEDSRMLAALQKDHDPLLLTSEHERLVKTVSALRGDVEGLERTQGTDEKLKAARQALGNAEKRLVEANQTRIQLEQMEKKSASDRADYEKWKQTLEGLESSLKSGMDPQMVIMERPLSAVMKAPDLIQACVSAAILGGGAGLVLMLLAATFASVAYGDTVPTRNRHGRN